MNIIDLLKQQHEEAKSILERLMNEDDKKEAKGLVAQIGKALRLHMMIEEKLVYPAAARAFKGDEEEEDEVLEAFEEHATARRTLEIFEKTPVSDKRFTVRAKVLKELLEHHIEEEEKEMFPDLEKELGDEAMEKLSAQAEKKMPQFEEAVAGATRRPRSTGARAGSRGQSRRGKSASPARRSGKSNRTRRAARRTG
jgi:hemerythrin-like domain-containing protein